MDSLEVAKVLQTLDILRTLSRHTDSLYPLEMEPGQDDFVTYEKPVTILADQPTYEKEVWVAHEVDGVPTHDVMVERRGRLVAAPRGVRDQLLLITYDEVVMMDKSVWRRRAVHQVVGIEDVLKGFSADEIVSTVMGRMNTVMTKLRQRAADINSKYLVLGYVRRGNVRDKYLEAADARAGKATEA